MRKLCYPSLLILLLTACASQPAVMEYHQTQTQKVWPAPPDAPRYRFAGVLQGESNFSREEGSSNVRRAVEWLVGLVVGESQALRLQRPAAGLTDAVNGRVYVTDVGSHAVFVFDQADGRLLRWEAAQTNLNFVSPIGIGRLANGDILVADAELALVVRLNEQGEPLATIGEGLLQRPTGLTVDEKTQRVFVADSQAHDIKVFDAAGELLDSWGERGEQHGQFNGPTHVSFQNGRLYVTDTLNARVQVLDANGKFLFTFGKRGVYLGNMPRPKGLAVDAAGRIYVVESYYDYLLVYDAEGRLLLPMGGSGAKPGQFNLPAGVWTDGDNRIFVADMLNGRVVSFEYIGEDEIAASGNPQ